MSGKSPNEILAEALQQCCELDASLNERLERFATISRSLNPAHARQIDELVSRLRQSGAGAGSPRPGDPMPPFLLADQDGRLVGLDDVVRQGPAALVFHRGHWCPYCRINTKTLAQAHDRIKDLGGTIIAIMPDRQMFTARMRQDLDVPFPVLSDLDNGYALSLNLAIWLGDELRGFFASRGHDLPRYQGNDAWIVPVPATFVIGTDGLIRERLIDPDYRQGIEIETLVSAFRKARGIMQ